MITLNKQTIEYMEAIGRDYNGIIKEIHLLESVNEQDIDYINRRQDMKNQLNKLYK